MILVFKFNLQRNFEIMKKIFFLLLCVVFLFSATSCDNNKNNDNNSDGKIISYTFEYDVFLEKIEQAIGSDEMFTSMEKISTHKSYDNNFTDLYALTSMLFEREYILAIIYENNSIKSIDVQGERAMISEGVYSFNTDYIVLSSLVYQILNEQPDAYGIMVDEFNMTSQDTQIMETEFTDNWIMIYSANNEHISFFSQIKTE